MLNTMNNPKKKSLLATERGEPNGVANKLAAESPHPNPEVLAQPKRRRFTAKYKARVVEEALKCTETGQIGELLRREGLYSSTLTQWRRQYQSGALQGLKDDKRGRKRIRDVRDTELEHLRRENERLSQKLRQAELIIDIQKKIATVLENPIETPASNKGTS